ncbi:MAG: MFS transporter [Myxococcota bacterium]|nr:MFS transporter [Myxococcota bacterium]
MRSLALNLRLLCGFRAIQMSMIPIAIVPLYWREDLGLSMAQIFSLQALFGLFAASFEFPGGYLADRIGYRSALACSTVFSAAGWVTLGFSVDFGSLLVGELFLAISLALSSGTDSALLYESCVELGQETEFGRWFGLSRSIGAVAEGSAALFAGLLYTIWGPLPFFVQAGLWAVNAVIVLALLEPARHPPNSGPAWQQVKGILAFALVENPRLRASIVVVTILGLSTFTPVWMVAVYSEKAGVDPTWIGPIWAAANYTVALGLWASAGVARRVGPFPALFACTGLITLGLAGMGVTHALWGFAFYFAVCLGRGVNGPILNHMQQRLIPSKDRASLLSLNSLAFRLGFFLLGPFLGLGVDRFGEHPVLLAAALVCSLAGAATVFWLQQSFQDARS